MRKAILTSFIIASLLIVFLVIPVAGASNNPIIDQNISYRFGEELEFTLTLTGEEEPQETWLFIQPKGLGIATFSIDIQETGENLFLITPDQLVLKPFSAVTYWYQLEYEDGTEVVTDEEIFYYVDNRVDWQHISNDKFDLYWQDGSHEFGLAALNIAQQAWDDLVSDYPAAPESSLMIYLYPSSADLQEALQLGKMPWVAGHADPQLNAILISIVPGPEQRLEMQRQIPHELAHLFTYASLEDGYINQPRWLLEGLASMAETADNEHYSQALNEAALRGSLISMDALCDAFPAENGEVYLAYAQSLSFTKYLQTEYGQNKLQELMAAYGEGLSCDAGFQRTYEMSLAQAQVEWQQAVLGTQRATLVWREIAPYLLLLVVLGGIPLAVTLVRQFIDQKKNHE